MNNPGHVRDETTSTVAEVGQAVTTSTGRRLEDSFASGFENLSE